MIPMNLPMIPFSGQAANRSPAGSRRYKYPARQSHVLQGITPHRDVKTLRLGTRLHQRKADNSRSGRTVVLPRILLRVARAGASP
jgi:hypothetical protein